MKLLYLTLLIVITTVYSYCASVIEITNTVTGERHHLHTVLANSFTIVTPNKLTNTFEITSNSLIASNPLSIKIISSNATTLAYTLPSNRQDLSIWKSIASQIMSSGSSSWLQVGIKDTTGRVFWQKTSGSIRSSYHSIDLILSTANFQNVGTATVSFNQAYQLLFKLQSADSSTITLDQLVLMDHIPNSTGIFSVSSFAKQIQTRFNTNGTDVTPPELQASQINGQSIVAGDYVDQSPVFTFYVKELESGVASATVVINNAEINQVYQTPLTGNQIILIVTASATIADGAYQAKVQFSDVAGNVSSWQTLPTFNIRSELTLENLLNGPNPFNPNNEVTHLEYHLSQPAKVDAYIYSISGRELWHNQYAENTAGGHAGFNSDIWDGRDKYGVMVANGPYVAYVVAVHNGKKAFGKVKILVLK